LPAGKTRDPAYARSGLAALRALAPHLSDKTLGTALGTVFPKIWCGVKMRTGMSRPSFGK